MIHQSRNMSAYNDGCHQSPVSARADECERKSGVRPSSSIWGEGVAQVDEDRIRITGFAPARQLLRWEGLRQAGFKAALLERIRSRARIAVLFQEGEIHQAQRIATARFFAPRVVDTRYRALMTTLSLRVSQLRPGPRGFNFQRFGFVPDGAPPVARTSSATGPRRGSARRPANSSWLNRIRPL